ncbi:hypothetical protein B0A50_04805 [Salinomyces thailandicus]|uniref:Pentatricopeptide repeat protein n=1 Tax=Salinomyces thailandicus TaxID=706561 RepID=A0A4U0TWK6_9PEZI|nr:hypothetical protein B0A50_04805 [Salinomyces thailandica]
MNVCVRCHRHARLYAQLQHLQRARRGRTFSSLQSRTQQYQPQSSRYSERSRNDPAGYDASEDSSGRRSGRWQSGNRRPGYYTADDPFAALNGSQISRRKKDEGFDMHQWRPEHARTGAGLGRRDVPLTGSGRYSRGSLHPEQLLEEMDREPAPARQRRDAVRRKPDLVHSQQRTRLSPTLNEKVDAFLGCGGTGLMDGEAWRILQSIIREENARETKLLGQHRLFSRAYMSLALRLARQSLTLSRQERAKNGIPNVALFLQLLPSFYLDPQDFWPRMLWLVASTTLELPDPPLSPARRCEALDELILMWNMAFASRLTRHHHSPLNTATDSSDPPYHPPITIEDMTWSFLPDLSTLRYNLRQNPDTARTLTFAEALGMYLPVSKASKAQSIRSGIVHFYDYPSAALVTLDLLHSVRPTAATLDRPGASPAAKEGLPYPLQAEYAPFVQFLEGLLALVKKPIRPQALREKLGEETGEVKAKYLGAVRRGGCKLPPLLEEGTEGAPSQGISRLSIDGGEEAVGVAGSTPSQPIHENSARPSASSATSAAASGLSPSDFDEPQYKTTILPNDVSAEEASNSNAASTKEDVETRNMFSASADAFDPPPSLPRRSETTRNEVTGRFINLRIKFLTQALQNQNPGLAERVKSEVFDFAASPEKPRLPDDLFEHLMLTLMSLQRPQAAIEVWNHFITSERTPTAKTYTVMMRGAQHVRDVNAMEIFWHKMRTAGVQPDANAWSTRIFGLIRGNKVDAGVQALGLMGQEWIAAARAKRSGGGGVDGTGKRRTAASDMPAGEAAQMFSGDVDGVARPTQAVMNSAISALASRNDKLIPRILQWGRNFNLEPDQTTYNVLLNLSMRHGEDEEAMNILKRMNERGVPVDSQTWTIILTALFHDPTLLNAPPQAQETKVLSFLTSLESASSATGIDQKGYALIIDRLLKLCQNAPAASAVLAHMLARGITPTTHIYTILLTYYFSLQPVPDFPALDALWSRIRAAHSPNPAPLDHVFYDRAIEGYAASHHHLNSTAPMRHFYHLLVDSGRRPSWRALEFMARAFAERGENDFLLEIAERAREWVIDDNGEILVGPRAWGQRGFWEFVQGAGVLGELSVEELMRGRLGMGGLERRMGRTLVG